MSNLGATWAERFVFLMNSYSELREAHYDGGSARWTSCRSTRP